MIDAENFEARCEQWLHAMEACLRFLEAQGMDVLAAQAAIKTCREAGSYEARRKAHNEFQCIVLQWKQTIAK